MDASYVCSHSVFDLISKLAALLLQDERAQTQQTYAKTAFVPKPAEVSKKRAIIYESLLHLRDYKICPRLDRFPKCKKLLDEEREYFDDKLISDITYCLLKVSKPPNIENSLTKYFQSHADGVLYKSRLLRPKPMRLEVAPRDRSLHDVIFTKPKQFKSIKAMHDQLGVLTFKRKTNILLSDIKKMQKATESIPEPKITSSILKQSLARMKELSGSAEPLITKFPTIPHLKDEQKKRELSKEQQRKVQSIKGVDSSKEDLKKGHPRKGVLRKGVPRKEAPKNEKPEFKKADNNKKFPDKYFLSDVCMTNEIKWHQNKEIELSFIKLSDFIDHLKKASVGLQSETFSYANDGQLELRPNSTIESVLPEVLEEYSQPFLAAGCAYQRLNAHTEWYYSDNHIERPMNRTMRQAIITFLANSRLFLLSQPAKNLSQLLHSAGPTMQMLLQLDQMFQTERRLNIGHGTSGAFLLKVIWSAIDVCVNIQYLKFLMYLLRSLCETYCGQLQRWIYHGVLEEQFNEIFVGTQRCLDEKSKDFFDRGYFVRSHMVPGFLTGCESAIVQCGKYSHLLKSFNARHMLFNIKHPDLVVCLSQDQITKMQQKLEQHYTQLMQNILPFRMQSVIEDHSARKFRFGNRMWSCTQEHIADWKTMQQDLQIKANEVKLRRYEEINSERKEQEDMHLEQRRMEIATELAFQQKIKEQDEECLRREKVILEERIAAYQEDVNPMTAPVGGSSPDESTNSSRSFVSCCDELDPELATNAALDANESAIKESKLSPQSVADARQSDQQNSNEPEEIDQKQTDNDADMEMDRNRKRNICSEQFQDCQNEEVKLKQTATAHSLTDMECNRLRVLGCTDMELPTDVNMNVEDLSDMQRNRQRMHQHEAFGSFNAAKPRSKSVETPTKTKKISIHNVGLSMDLHLPLERHKLFVEPSVLDAGTPMSITSDVDIETFIQNETVDAANNNNIKENINSSITKEKKPIKTPPKLPEESASQLETPKVDTPIFQLQRTATVATCPRQESPSDHNALLIKLYVQQSIMVPLKTHLSLLRNEVLRVFDDLNVYEHFCQLRNYYFLLDGEFGTMLISGLLERIESGMEPSRLCKSALLDTILNNALGHRATDGAGTTAALVAENLKLTFTTVPESFDLMDNNALSIFTLVYKVDWPLNLVISLETVNKYKQIFTHLLKLRHVNYMLERVYQHLQQLGKLHGKALQGTFQYRHLQMIRHKLSHFVVTLQNHLDTNALHGTWETFNDKLRQVDSIEELYQRHVEYLKHIAFLTLLNRRSVKFRETIDNILVIVLRFCKILHSKQFELDENQEFYHPRYKRLVFEEAEFEKFLLYVIYLGEKVDASGYQDKIVELIRNINFNSYYNVTNSTNQA